MKNEQSTMNNKWCINWSKKYLSQIWNETWIIVNKSGKHEIKAIIAAKLEMRVSKGTKSKPNYEKQLTDRDWWR